MESHARKYSKGYAAGKGYTFWEKDFDAMACKTMLRQLLSKWGAMDTDLQKAYESDGAVIKQDLTGEYLSFDEQEAPETSEAKEPEYETPEAPKAEKTGKQSVAAALFGKE